MLAPMADVVLDPAVSSRLQAALGAEILRAERLAGGACQDNFLLEVAAPADPGNTPTPRRWVLRSDARTSLPGSIDRAREYEVMRAAVRAGVRTPAPLALLPALFAPGTAAYLLPFFPGEAIGRKIVKGPELAAARRGLAAELGAELAKVHAVSPRTEPDLFAAPPSAKSAAATRIDAMRASMDGLHRKRPALEWLLRWLAEHAPADPADTLVHGDFRTGNFLVTPSGLSAVLDWEFAHWGSPYEDLSWISVRDWRFGQLALPIGGFSVRSPFYEAYEAQRGQSPSWRGLDPALLHYWEVLGNVGWALGAACQAERYTHGGEQDLELLAIGRRASEMEWEALRLVERGAI